GPGPVAAAAPERLGGGVPGWLGDLADGGPGSDPGWADLVRGGGVRPGRAGGGHLAGALGRPPGLARPLPEPPSAALVSGRCCRFCIKCTSVPVRLISRVDGNDTVT